MTDPDWADATYLEPLDLEGVTGVLRRERPDALLPTLGGQTALNLAMELERGGRAGRARHRADRRLRQGDPHRRGPRGVRRGDGLGRAARAALGDRAHARAEARAALGGELQLPVAIRPAFTLGGHGGGFARTPEELDAIVLRGLNESPISQVLMEESVEGWGEFELEVIRDRLDNVVIVCSIENLDPMGVHTGDSVCCAPAMTLSDREYQALRDAAAQASSAPSASRRAGSNVQFAVNRETGEIVVIEMNPRVSRSSALASKATGYPIAKVATRLAIGYTLDEIPNDITGTTPASFEPTIDYVVVKAPRFAFEKFAGSDETLTTQMKSVGEAMGIGRCFNEAYGKAMRSRELDRDPREGGELATPAWDRFDALLGRLRAGEDADALSAESSVHPWFCHELARRVAREDDAAARGLERPRRRGAAPAQARGRLGRPHRATLRLRARTTCVARRLELGVRPVFKTVDSCGGEVAAETSYLYSSYDRIDEPLEDDRPAGADPRLGPEPHRPGHRVRLLLRPGGAQLPRAGLRGGHGQLQSRDGLDRLRHGRPALLRAAHGRGRARGRRARAADRRGRAVRRADAAQARAPPRRPRRADPRHEPGGDRPRGGSRALRRPARRSSACARPTGRSRATPRRRSSPPSASATRCSCGRPTCSAAARCASATRRTTCARRRSRRTRSSTASSRTRSRSTSTPSATARTRSWRPSWSTSRRPACTRATRPA